MSTILTAVISEHVFSTTMALTICSSIGEVTVTSNNSDVNSQVKSSSNDLVHLLVTPIDVTSMSKNYG